MTKEIFIVNSEEGTKVVSANVLANELKKSLEGTKVKRCDIESMATEAVRANTGKAISIEDHLAALERYRNALIEYSELTPYSYFTKSDKL